ncbi:CHAP domain-containing protein [Planotetraspora silvatica]|nr:CHAP domain-containing protein [Planotetraspora silvatica]
MKKLLHLLHTQVGYGEQASGYTKFGHWYDTVENDADYTSQPWCDMFLSWGAHKLGYAPWFGQFAYTVSHARWFKQHHAWGSTPVPGAVVFFDWAGTGTIDGIDHVGIVVKVAGKKIHTIEGNTGGGQVREQVRDQSSVVGYGYPEKIRTHQEQKVIKAGRATAAATAHQTMSLPSAAPHPAEAPPAAAPTAAPMPPATPATPPVGSPTAPTATAPVAPSAAPTATAPTTPPATPTAAPSASPATSPAPAHAVARPAASRPPHHLSRAGQTTPGRMEPAASSSTAASATGLTDGASVTVRPAVVATDASAGAGTAAHSDPDARTASHITPASIFEPATTTRPVADFQPLPGIPPQLGDTAIITPLLVAVLAAAYVKVRRGAVRRAITDGAAQAILDSPAASRTPGNTTSGEERGWFTPVRMNAVADRADVPPPPLWPTTPVNRPAAPPPPPPTDAHPADAHPADAHPADAHPAGVHPAGPSAVPEPEPVYFMPDLPDPSAPEGQTTPGPSLYQGSDGLANALEAFWNTNLQEGHADIPAAAAPNDRPIPDMQARPDEHHTEQRASDVRRADEQPASDREPASDERPSPARPRRPKGGRHRKS